MLRLLVLVALLVLVRGETTDVNRCEYFFQYIAQMLYKAQQMAEGGIAIQRENSCVMGGGHILIGTVSAGDLPINAYIEGCSTPPCGLPQQQNAIIHIFFRAPRTIPQMTTLATAYLSVIGLPVPIPYPLGEYAVTCNFLENSYCPVLEGEILHYALHMMIEETFPVGVSPTIEFRIVDETNVPIVCIRVPITILQPVTGTSAYNSTHV